MNRDEVTRKRKNQNVHSSDNEKQRIIYKQKYENIRGLTIIDDFINILEAKGLIDFINKNGKWNNSTSGRTIHYGYEYDDYKKTLKVAQNIPEWLNIIKKEVNGHFGNNDLIDQIIINEYKQGHGISKHIDDPELYGETIATLILGYAFPIIFVNDTGNIILSVYTPTNSLIVLDNQARYDWTHESHMPLDVDEISISITFRSITNRNKLKN